MSGVLRILPLFAPRVVRMMTGMLPRFASPVPIRELSVVPSVPPELSYSSTWSRTSCVALGSYSPLSGMMSLSTQSKNLRLVQHTKRAPSSPYAGPPLAGHIGGAKKARPTLKRERPQRIHRIHRIQGHPHDHPRRGPGARPGHGHRHPPAVALDPTRRRSRVHRAVPTG